MKRILFAAGLFVTALFVTASPAAAFQLAAPTANDAAPSAPPLHESFDYGIEWRLINAGKAHLDWTGSPGNPEAGDVRLHIESAGMVSRLYLVDDRYSATLA